MEIKLKAQLREKGEKLGAEHIPGVVYGNGVESLSLKLQKVEFEKVYRTAGESNLINLDYGQGPVRVLIKEIQRNILKHTFRHVDFYQVNMKEKITAEIPLHIVGESKAVRELGGTLIQEMDALEVRCLPGDLVDHIDVDISGLHSFEDNIRIEDLKLPEGVEAVGHPDVMIAAVREPKAVEEEPVAPADGAAAPAEAAKAGEGAGEQKAEEKK